MIDLANVCKQFGGRRDVAALNDVTVAIPRGQLVSIVGPSGSGKSTLLNLLGGLDRATSGRVSIDGQTLGGLNDDALTRIRREKIGFIFQFFNLLPTLSCLETGALPLPLRHCPRGKGEARARKLLEFVKLAPRMTPLPENLPGGERQRVPTARAFWFSPPIL